ncbi:MAG: ATP-binding protein [Rhodocyclaceae bacterium]|nr:ATP-binding protein [Rhodocyclaceae bacterium]
MTTRQKKPATADPDLEVYRRMSALWLFRLLANAHLPDRLVAHALSQDAAAYLLGAEETVVESSDPFGDPPPPNCRHARRQVAATLRRLESEGIELGSSVLGRNVAMLGDLVGLDTLEREVLGAAVLMTGFRAFGAALGNLDLGQTNQYVAHYLGVMLRQPRDSLRRILSPDGVLQQMCLVETTRDLMSPDIPLVAPEEICNALMSQADSPDDLVRHFFRPATPSGLTEEDFSHLAADLGLLTRLVGAALGRREKGVNILLHGEPGTGKSELARVLAAAAGARLYEVSHADDAGETLGSRGRLSSYVVCQRVLQRGTGSMILFDEMEDVFPGGQLAWLSIFNLSVREERSPGKAWINRILETNPVPTIWISNRVGHLDPAYLRRFDMVLEVPRPPAVQRRRIADKHLGDTAVGAPWLNRLGTWEDVTPAQLEKAARVTRLVGASNGQEAEQVAEWVLRASARALGQKPPPRGSAMADYRLDCVNATPDAAELVAGLRRRGRGTFCFYGPPGTGKTALARHMAEAIGRPLMVRRASDLLGMWVGESEARIAEMFRRAREEEAVLLVDEADGLLADRREAHQSWEVTQVNEMLTWMEDFEGIFICTTNLPDRLDAASLRRFDFKVRFDYLRPDQRVQLLRATWTLSEPLPAAVVHRLGALDALTPGDFAVVARQWALTGEAPEASRLVEALAEECRLKGHAGKAIGFLA